ncbi:hypothetical protein [Nocardia aurea]|uniref:Uncharacterized protein n=1 Tax=Nocardia aurea TaxID=2144174 RepID=A0ABV3G1I9_9NOCA
MGIRTVWRRGRQARINDKVDGWLQRGEVDRLCRGLERHPDNLRAISAVTGIMSSSPDAAAALRARRTLDGLCVKPGFFDSVVSCFIDGGGRSPSDHGCALTATSVSFLFAPLPNSGRCRHIPKIRFVEFLDSPHSHHGDAAARWLVEVVLRDPHAAVPEPVTQLLCGTNQPKLLDALEEAFVVAVSQVLTADDGPDGTATLRRIWTPEGQATPFTHILTSNWRIRDRSRGSEAGIRPRTYSFLKADLLQSILTDRRWLVTRCLEKQAKESTGILLDAARLSGTGSFAERCRETLLTLESDEARDALCDWAILTSPPQQPLRPGGHYATDPRGHRARLAREIVLETGFTWKRAPAVFLFLTEQWDRYDALDPDGSIVHAYCTPRRHEGWYEYSYSYPPDCSLLAGVARENQRPDPRPPLPPSEPIPGSYDGGGGDGGGWGGCGGGGCGGGD